MYDGQAAQWHAELALQFSRVGGRTLCAQRHRGPLRVQKPLYPEGAAVCHAVVIHPPGGIAGGDVLDLSIDVRAGAHALLTTPGAAKWYKANGRPSFQRILLGVEGVLEWLPQEAIVFDAADVSSAIDIDLADSGLVIGWDVVALGRRAAGERFARGRFVQSIRLRTGGTLTWHERTRVTGGDALLDSPVGLAGRHVFGCLWAAGAAVEHLDLDELRAELGAHATVRITRLAPYLLVARALTDGTTAAREGLTAVWQALRPRVCGRAVQTPRLWAT
ncbi:MAG TPA: urease accessory protein UreD [Burkholderiaceae bacterium]|nr:urease accessory protein UreD [Burkholderiaceae bacterium]